MSDDATFTNDEVVAVDQVEGTSYNALQDLGVKLGENGAPLDQGEYTIILSGENSTLKKELLIIGDAGGIPLMQEKTLGAIRDVTIANKGNRWSYACVCTVEPATGGVVMQRYSGGRWQYSVKNLSTFDKTFKKDTVIDSKVDIGFQVNEFTENPENVKFTIIPFND